MLAALAVYGGATLVVLYTLYLLTMVSLAAEFAGFPTACLALALMAGVGMLVLEYHALHRRNARCAIAIGTVSGATSLLFLVLTTHAAHVVALLVLVPIAGGMVFCAIAHFVWASRLSASSPRRWRV